MSNFPSYLLLTLKCFEVAESCSAIESAEYQQYFQTCGNVFPHTWKGPNPNKEPDSSKNNVKFDNSYSYFILC